MRRARPSAIAVLPTPASPTSSGLFLRRRHSVSMTLSSSRSRSAAMRGVCSVMCCVRFLRSSSMLAPQERSTSAAVGLSSSASSRCSTVMNSWRFCRASTNAMCRLTSSSWAIISGFLHHALQRMLVLARIVRDLAHLGRGDVARVDAAHAHALAVDFQHHLGCPLPGHAEKLLQHQYDELHRREVVVQQQNLVHRRKFYLRLLCFEYRVVLVLHACGNRPFVS